MSLGSFDWRWLLGLLVPLFVGGASGYTASSVQNERRLTTIEVRMDEVKHGLEQQMNGYANMVKTVVELNQGLRNELESQQKQTHLRLDRIEWRLDRGR